MYICDFDTDQYLMVAKIREKLAANKQRPHRFNTEMFSIKTLNEAQGREKYRVEVSNRFAALEDLNAEVEINTVWEKIKENIKM
jgi:hypothetical protein